MGTKGIEIVGMDVNKLLEMLNKALADEWLAYYQYWVGARVVKGPMRELTAEELEEHAEEELEHAEKLAERIIQLGGTPVLSPDEWSKLTNCGYEVPKDPHVEKILDQNIKGEQCAIDVYNKLAELTRGTDQITFGMIMSILKDEVKHEEDLQAIVEDLEIMKGGK